MIIAKTLKLLLGCENNRYFIRVKPSKYSIKILYTIGRPKNIEQSSINKCLLHISHIF